MTERDQFEQEAVLAAQREVSTVLPELARRGLQLGPLEVKRSGDGEAYESEVCAYVYRDGQICDALEVRTWRNGGPAVTIAELGEWFRAELLRVR